MGYYRSLLLVHIYTGVSRHLPDWAFCQTLSPVPPGHSILISLFLEILYIDANILTDTIYCATI